MVSLQPPSPQLPPPKFLGMTHGLHSSPTTNNFVLERGHIVSTVTTNGIVPGTSVSDSHTDTVAGAGEGAGPGLAGRGAPEELEVRGLLWELRKALSPCWEAPHLPEPLGPGFCEHADGGCPAEGTAAPRRGRPGAQAPLRPPTTSSPALRPKPVCCLTM